MTNHRFRLEDAVVTVGPDRIPIRGFASGDIIVTEPPSDYDPRNRCRRCRADYYVDKRCQRCGEPWTLIDRLLGPLRITLAERYNIR